MRQPTSTYEKYKTIVISVILFLIMDVSVLAMNFYISFQVSKDAVSVNLSGRQRMLTQRTAKSLLSIDKFYNEGNTEEIQKSVKELETVRNLFDSTLHAFQQGAVVTGADGEPVFLQKVSSDEGMQAVEKGLKIWLPYRDKIDSLLKEFKNHTLNEEHIETTAAYAAQNNLPLLALMNDLTIATERIADSKAKFMRAIQTGGIILSLINFLVVMTYSLRHLRKADENIREAQKETTDILDNVNEGLFLLDKELVIGKQHSAKLEEIIGQKNIGGRKFTDLVANLVPEQEIDVVQGFIGQLYSNWVMEDLIADLNPLNEVKVSRKNGAGPAYLNFKFSRVYEDKEIVRVLVVVTDITNSVLLKESLERESDQNEKQIQLLNSILNIEDALLKEFITNTKKRTASINSILQNPKQDKGSLYEKANHIYREVHSMKGEASSIRMTPIVTACHLFEEKIKQLQNKKDLVGEDFLGLVVALDEIINLLGVLENLNQRIQRSAPAADAAASPPGLVHQNYLKHFAEDLAQRNRKQVLLLCHGIDDAVFAQNSSWLKNIAVQLLRNAVVHGIESPEDRIAAKKMAAGKIMLILTRNGSKEAVMVIEDDGAGINFDKIRAKAVERGLYTEEQAARLSPSELVALIFRAGFSTADSGSEDAGRGVGMDIIRDEIEKRHGKIKIASVPGKYTRISLSFPLN